MEEEKKLIKKNNKYVENVLINRKQHKPNLTLLTVIKSKKMQKIS